MTLSNSIGNCLNRKTALFIVFWYSVSMLIGAFYYSHLRWTEETNISRALYNSLYLPTLSPVTHRTLSNVNATPSVPPFNHLVSGRERKITEILRQEKTSKVKSNKDHRVGRKTKPSKNETQLEWLFENINNSESLDRTDNLDKTASVRTNNKTRLKEKYSEEDLEIQLLDSLKRNISLLNNHSDSGSKMTVLLGSPPKKNNSSFIIAAIEENMQKIRRETEISLQRLSELSGYLKGSNSTNAKDAGALLRTVDDATHLEQNLGQQRDWILNLTNSVLDEKGDPESDLDGQQMIAKQIKELLQRSSTLEKLRLKYEAQRRDMVGEEPVVSLESVMEKGTWKMHGGKSLTRQIAEMIGVSVPPKEPALKKSQATKKDGYYLIETRKELTMQCDSCAVVSSSGQLVNSSAGKYIDSYPCIIRMNSAPTSGFEEDVGSRTTVRVMGHVNLMKINSSMEEQQEIFINSSTRTNKMIIPWLFGVKSNKRRDKYYLIAKNFSEAYRSTEFYVLSSKKMVEAEKIFQAETGISRSDAKTWLSTGFMTILFAIDVCSKIDIFGLVPENFCQKHTNDSTPYHYYEQVDGKLECAYYKESEERLKYGHLFVTEKAMFARWASKYNMNFRYPSWNITELNFRNKTQPLDTPFLKLYHEAQVNRSKLAKSKSKGFLGIRSKVRKVPVVIGPKSKGQSDKEKYQKFTHVVMFIVAIFLSLVVFLLLFLLAIMHACDTDDV
ncbi:uncharacterized protein [Apostichopus japonicus]|uniref:uncharacterized protein isoform X2 n=1 Tax=Stichopus japonicus TaxID=307972 RepID=UPI003AB5AA13